jgi:hypothetical protein
MLRGAIDRDLAQADTGPALTVDFYEVAIVSASGR